MKKFLIGAIVIAGSFASAAQPTERSRIEVAGTKAAQEFLKDCREKQGTELFCLVRAQSVERGIKVSRQLALDRVEARPTTRAAQYVARKRASEDAFDECLLRRSQEFEGPRLDIPLSLCGIEKDDVLSGMEYFQRAYEKN